MENEKRLIPLRKRIIYAGDVFNSLIAEKKWSATEAADFVKELRTVDAVEVVHGNWEDDHGDYVCCCCHTVFTDELVWIVRGENNEPNYCPYCGAKMDGGNEDV